MRGLAAITTVGFVAVAPVLLALATRGSAAEPAATLPTVRLSWVRAQGADGCIDRDGLARDVNARLGRDAFGGTPTRSIEGTVAREGSKWVARLYVRDASGALSGDRELTSEAADCASLSSAVTLAVALVIDPDAALGPPSASASTSMTATVLTSATLDKIPGTSPSGVITTIIESPIVPRPRPVVAEARFGVSTGLVPKVAPAVLLGLEGTTTFHPRVLALLVPGTRTEDGSAGFGITAANLGACVNLAADEVVSLSACVGAVAGVVHSYVYGLQPVTPGDRAWFAASTGLDGSLRIAGPVRLVFGIEALWPITRHRFLAEGRAEPLFRQPFVTILGSLGAGIAFQ